MRKSIILISFILFLIAGFCFAQSEESITITTYYPSPYGSYSELTVNRDLTNNSDTVTGLSIDIDESGTNTGTITGLEVDVSGVTTGTYYAATFQGGNVNINGGQFGSDIYVIGSSGSSQTIDWNNGNTQHITLTANCTLTFSNGISGRKYTLIVKQDGSGSRTITWPASVRWSGGTAPTLTTTANRTDYFGFIYNSVDSTYDGIAQQFDF